ncbi:MAG: TraR/DksA C4-type zinc finger protein [Chitinophagales bacterium]|nr:TraR/DksA C4-type zinc finger protein [Chitinophagales bacterium]
MTTEEIRKKVEEEIAKTKQLILEYREMAQPVEPDVAIGRISRMDAINNKSVAEAALREAENKLTKLHFVLSKVGTSEFGICQKCKAPIPLGRILIKPESMFCVKCAR